VTDLSYDVYGEDSYMIETFKQNERLYTKRQVEESENFHFSYGSDGDGGHHWASEEPESMGSTFLSKML
jgi:hypothetical protein